MRANLEVSCCPAQCIGPRTNDLLEFASSWRVAESTTAVEAISFVLCGTVLEICVYRLYD